MKYVFMAYNMLMHREFKNISKIGFWITMKRTNKSIKLVLVGALSLLMANANAALIQGVGVYAGASTNSNCPSYCNGASTYASSGDEGVTEATAETNEYAHAKAYASFVPGSYLPLLRVETSAIEGRGAGATAYSVQNFTYIGTGTKSIELDVNLHGSVSSNSGNSLSAGIAILSGTSLPWFPDYGSLVYEFGYGLQMTSPEHLSIHTGDDVNTGTTITFDVNAGESFYIVSEMNANAKNGYADAWNTLSMNFRNGSNLQAALQVASPVTPPTGVPEPSSLAIFGLSLLLLLGRKVAK